MRRIALMVAALIALSCSAAAALQVSGELSRFQSAELDGYFVDVYYLETIPGQDLRLSAASRRFTPHVITMNSQTGLCSNRGMRGVSTSGRRSRIELSSDRVKAGYVTVVVTARNRGRGGFYNFDYQGARLVGKSFGNQAPPYVVDLAIATDPELQRTAEDAAEVRRNLRLREGDPAKCYPSFDTVHDQYFPNRKFEKSARATEDEIGYTRMYQTAALAASTWNGRVMDWPPPRASARAVIDPADIAVDDSFGTLGDLGDALVSALDDAGYEGPGFLGVPGGYALVTRMEQTDVQGIPYDSPARWSANVGVKQPFSVRSYLWALFRAPVGYFRIVVLVVSDQPFAPTAQQGTLGELAPWSDGGLNVLPAGVAALPLTDQHVVTALIYEFEKTSQDEPVVNIPGRLTVSDHLAHTSLTQAQ